MSLTKLSLLTFLVLAGTGVLVCYLSLVLTWLCMELTHSRREPRPASADAAAEPETRKPNRWRRIRPWFWDSLNNLLGRLAPTPLPRNAGSAKATGSVSVAVVLAGHDVAITLPVYALLGPFLGTVKDMVYMGKEGPAYLNLLMWFFIATLTVIAFMIGIIVCLWILLNYLTQKVKETVEIMENDNVALAIVFATAMVIVSVFLSRGVTYLAYFLPAL